MTTNAIIFIIIVTIISVILTLQNIGKGEDNYRSSAKKNTANLTIIYSIAIVASLIALAVYIRIF